MKTITKTQVIYRLKCADEREYLDGVIQHLTNNRVSLADYKGDYTYEDLYKFIKENSDEDVVYID